MDKIKELENRLYEAENDADYWKMKFEQAQKENEGLRSWLALAEKELEEAEQKICVELDSYGELSCSNTGEEFGNIIQIDPLGQKLIKALIEERNELDDIRGQQEFEIEELQDKVEELQEYVDELRRY